MKFLLIILMVFLLSACDSAEESDVKKAFKMSSNEPDSVIFGDVKVFFIPESKEKRACFSANSKNIFGGMTGFKTYTMRFEANGWNSDVREGTTKTVDECVHFTISFEFCYKKYERWHNCFADRMREKFKDL